MAYTAPLTATAGTKFTAASWNASLRDNLNALVPSVAVAWSTYTPTITQSVNVTKTVNYARYWQIGKQISGIVELSATSGGSAANAIFVSLPVTGNGSYDGNAQFGSGFIYDASTTIKYRMLVEQQSTTLVRFLTLHSTTDGLLGSTDFTVGLAAGDIITFNFTYEAA